jgi:hypothetical protein
MTDLTLSAAGSDAVIRAFFEAAEHADAILRMPDVEAAWNDPGVLPRMTVGAIAGHVLLVVRRVDQHLDDPEMPTGDSSSAGYQWMRVATAADLHRAEHRVVRADGERVAEWGWQAVMDSYAECVAALRERLALRVPTTVTLGDSVMPFDSYLETRIVELLVHADDLCVSVGVADVALPITATLIALGTLLEAARATHGDLGVLGVLRALTRSERTPPSVPSVY